MDEFYNMSEKIGRIETVANGGLPFAFCGRNYFICLVCFRRKCFLDLPHNYPESIIQASYLFGLLAE